jgi:hypothetical protein
MGRAYTVTGSSGKQQQQQADRVAERADGQSATTCSSSRLSSTHHLSLPRAISTNPIPSPPLARLPSIIPSLLSFSLTPYRTMAAVTAAAVSLSSFPAAAKAAAASPPSPSSCITYPRRSAARAVRVQVSTTETAEAGPAPVKTEKISKKQDEGVVTNKYKPKEPYVGRCLLNTRITGDKAPGETWHMVFSTEG